jgi:hypothetical protein
MSARFSIGQSDSGCADPLAPTAIGAALTFGADYQYVLER